MPISLVLADDHRAILNGLEYILSKENDMIVLASCTNGEEALQAVRRHRPDILILDLCMPGKDGLTVLREMQKEALPTRVIILSGVLGEDEVIEALRLGARGVVPKEMALQFVVQCVREVHVRGEWLERCLASRALEKMLRRETETARIRRILTAREVEMIQMIASGLRNKEIASRLSITEATVKTHLHHIYEKLSVNSRTELIVYARNKDLI